MRILGQNIHSPILLLVAAEFALAFAAFAGAARMLLAVQAPLPVLEGLLFAFAVSLGLTAMGLYQARQRLRLESVLVRVVVGLGLAWIGLAVLNFVLPLDIGRLLWGWSFLVTLLLLSVGRIVFWKYVDHEAFRRRVLVYGAGERAAHLLKLRRRSDQRGFRIVAFVPAPGDSCRIEDSRVREIDAPLSEYARSQGVNEIVVAMDERRRTFPFRELLDCKFSGIAVLDVVEFLERETGKLKVELMNPSWLIFSEGFAAKPGHRVAGRVLDVVASLALIVVLFPIMLLVAIAILIDDGRPVLYRQQRVGLAGRSFTLYKFRSMIDSAEADGRAVWAGAEDQRITRTGRVMRKLRLDELPQLFNVLRGEMSLVGPRPERPEFVETLAAKIPYYHERHSVVPGITGWAQLCYPYGSSEADALEKLQFDLYYVKYRNFVFDLMVLLQTIEVILWGKGAR